LTREVPEQLEEFSLRPAEQQAHPGAVRRTSSPVSQPPDHDFYADQNELRGNVTDNKQKGVARVDRSFTLGVEVKR